MKNVLALGDSYTIGESVPENGRWVEQWAGLMRNQGHAIAQPVTIIAKNGWSTDDLQQGIKEYGPLGQFDLATLQIGVNNQYRGLPFARYRREFSELLTTARDAVGGRAECLQVLSFPDWGRTPFGLQSGRDLDAVSAETDAYNHCAKSLCQVHGVAFLDITELTRARQNDTAMHAQDGLHPSAAMYGLWAGALLCTGLFGRL